jgi:hypothetical protein
MTSLSELVIDDQVRLVETEEPVEVGDALIVEDEIFLVLRESDGAALRAEARFQCRRALSLRGQAEELLAYSKELQLKLIEAREIRMRMDENRQH